MESVKRLALLIALWAIAVVATGLVPYVWSHEGDGRRVAWLILVACTLTGASLLTWLEMKLRRQPDIAKRDS
ncbi:hypothetical protein ACFWA4_05245 [Streptomyces sp. NPDC060011]|uniref:hypothetical protein n=1 Tax=unclassified Streptomyces TaxID=2593676 RepID=UPI00367437C5